MKKLWLGGAAVVVLGLLVLWFRLRPAPQDQLWKGVLSAHLPTTQGAMDRGADATLSATSDNKFLMLPGNTPLQTYLSHSTNIDGIKALLQKADLSVQAETHRLIPLDMEDGLFATPLHYVVLSANSGYASTLKERERKPLLQLLLRHGAPVNAKAKTPAGLTPLMLAQEEWVARVLLDAGADPDLVAANGACIMNHVGKEPKYNALWRLLKKKGGRPRLVPDSPKFPRPVWSHTGPRIEKWVQTSADRTFNIPPLPSTFGAPQ